MRATEAEVLDYLRWYDTVGPSERPAIGPAEAFAAGKAAAVLAAASERERALREMLRKLEWTADADGWSCCPECRREEQHLGHEPGCALAALLAPAADRSGADGERHAATGDSE